MARYIDADKIWEEVESIGGHGLCEWTTLGVKELINRQPFADVVPKSEVERLEEELAKANADVKNYMKVAEYQQGLSVKRYHEIKRLNEDIDRLQKALDDYEETSGLKQAKAEVAREIFEEIWLSIATHAFTSKSEDYADGAYDTIEWVDSKITEIEKKYIPKDCRTCKHMLSCEPNVFGICDEYEDAEEVEND